MDDNPGVLAQIAGVLGKNNVSIASMIQRELEKDDARGKVSLVVMTHDATEGSAGNAISEIDKLSVVEPGSVKMRVVD